MATPLFSKQVKYKIEYENMDIFTNYETIRWKQIVNSLDRDSEQYKKYVDVFSKRKTIVAKIGNEELVNEYRNYERISQLNLATIAECYSKFNYLANTIIITPYIAEGDVGKCKWNRSNFDLFKNVLKHICMTVLFAFHKCGFLHGKLHSGNILLKRTKQTSVNYGEFGSLKVDGVLPVLVDFGDSQLDIGESKYVFQDLENLLTVISKSGNIKFEIDNLCDLLKKLIGENSVITKKTCLDISNSVDSIKINYIKSDMPPLAIFL